MIKKTSLSVKLPLLFTISMLVIMLVVVIAVHLRFQNRMIGEYDRMAKGVTQLMADSIDGDKVDEYIEQNFSSDEYNGIREYFYSLKENYPDVLYLYSYRCEEDGGHMIFDLDNDEVENGEAYEPGYVYELEEPFSSHQKEIMEGKETDGYAVSSEEDGYLYSYCRPVYDSNGDYACSVCVDFSLDQMRREDRAFTLRLALIILAIAVIVLIVEGRVVRHWVTDPINELSKCAEKFRYETEEDRGNNIDLLDDLDIRSKDEIGDVYQMLRSMTRDSFLSTFSLTQARQDIQDKEEQITEISKDAYRDSLTKVGSAAAFRRDAGDHEKTGGGVVLVLFDLNDLKHINDSYGHDKGDMYIMGCCAMICDTYKHSPVYRIGGDEFVVMLNGQDLENREALLSEIRAGFEESFRRADAAPWERYSASCGMAGGESMDAVLKQADREMYLEKERFHEHTGRRR